MENLDETLINKEEELVDVLEPGMFALQGNHYAYPSLVKRYKALLIDGFSLFAVMIITMVILDESESRSAIMITMGVIFGVLYEPLLTAYSATLGQRLMKIRVRSYSDPTKTISLVHAYLRWFVKGLLGWLSFLTIHANKEHRAIHDFAGASVMIEL